MKNRHGVFVTDKNEKYKYNVADTETIRLAEIIRNNRQNELNKANIYTIAESELLKAQERSHGDFIQYFRQLADERKKSNRDNWKSALLHLKKYTQKSDKSDTMRFSDITLQWCEGFKNYLLTVEKHDETKLATNTAATYFIKFKIALKSAYRFGYLPKDINRDLKSIKEVESHREFQSVY